MSTCTIQGCAFNQVHTALSEFYCTYICPPIALYSFHLVSSSLQMFSFVSHAELPNGAVKGVMDMVQMVGVEDGQ